MSSSSPSVLSTSLSSSLSSSITNLAGRNQLTCIMSCELFGGYETIIDLEKIHSFEDIVKIIKTRLILDLEVLKLVELKERLKSMEYHIHHVTLEQILKKEITKIYVCSHRDSG